MDDGSLGVSQDAGLTGGLDVHRLIVGAVADGVFSKGVEWDTIVPVVGTASVMGDGGTYG